MRRVDVAVQKADRDALDLLGLEPLGKRRHRRLVERRHHPAARVDPLGHDAAQPARHQGRRQVDIDVVLLEAVLVADLDRVAEAFGRDSAVLAPLRSMIALVASVVPWMMIDSLAGVRPASSSTARITASTPSSGACGVVSNLALNRLSPDLERDIGEGAADIDPESRLVRSRHARKSQYRIRKPARSVRRNTVASQPLRLDLLRVGAVALGLSHERPDCTNIPAGAGAAREGTVMSYSSPPGPHRFDVADETVGAYRAVFDNVQLVIEMALLPFAIVLATELVALILPGGGIFGRLLAALVSAVGMLLFGTIFVVRWHRFVLLGESVAGGLIPPGWSTFLVTRAQAIGDCLHRLDHPGFVALLPPHILTMPLSAIGGIALTLGSMRVSLIFPAAAIERPIGFMTASDLIAGNFWRLFVCLVMCYLPFVVVGYIDCPHRRDLPLTVLDRLPGACSLRSRSSGSPSSPRCSRTSIARSRWRRHQLPSVADIGLARALACPDSAARRSQIRHRRRKYRQIIEREAAMLRLLRECSLGLVLAIGIGMPVRGSRADLEAGHAVERRGRLFRI